MQSFDTLADALRTFRESGGRLAVDDAGSGFASLRHILRLNPDFIKIDGSLTQKIETEPIKRALVMALVAFAREIGISIEAEGIETSEQLEVLLSLGVRLGTGISDFRRL